MPDRPFRFLHTSDFRLDAVSSGLAEVPDHLRDGLLDAPYTAARRVFDVAISERVAFVLLAGNIVQAETAGPRGIAFLIEQFERLAAAGIDVYWAASETDRPETWPAALPLPKNVHLFRRDHVDEFLHTGDGPPLARIVGTSRGERSLHAADFVPDPVGLFSIATACGEMEPAEMQAQGIHYWALGGRPERATLFGSFNAEPAAKPGRAVADGSGLNEAIAHYPGTPQGRSRAEGGSRGCAIVSVGESGSAKVSTVPCSRLEWREESIAVGPATTRDELETMCAKRIHALAGKGDISHLPERPGGRSAQMRDVPFSDILVTWSIGGSGPLLTELRRGKLRGELLEWLRIEHGLSSPVVWTVALEIAPTAALPPALYEQETLLGDYLRELQAYETEGGAALAVEAILAGSAAGEGLARSVAIADAAARRRVLHEAALLGVDLLSGEEA